MSSYQPLFELVCLSVCSTATSGYIITIRHFDLFFATTRLTLHKNADSPRLREREREREREKDRDRERERETETETDRQTDTDRQTQ